MLTFTRIGYRLGAAFGLLLAIFLGSAVLASVHLAHIDQAQQRMEQARGRSVALSEWMNLVSANLSRAILATRLDQTASSDEALRQQLMPLAGLLNQEMAASAQAAQQAQQRILDLGATGSDGSSKLLAQIDADRDRFVALRMSIRDDVLLGDAGPRIEKELMPAAAAMEQSLALLQAHLQRGNAADAQALAALVEWAQWELRVASALALVIGILLAWRTTRAITRPLDEAAAFASAIATGDLSVNLQPRGRDEMARLQQGLVGMQRGLQDMLTEVRSTTDSISTASTQIASGNQDLSARTEQTASNLEETAASMEQLTATVRQSADAARQANQLATSASEIAARGGQVVGQVVTTMDEINASSRKISDIIGVIDAIAFQTNILALNAAVEAARAGEQGRGFAVVAGEVRNLAQRSAEAAKEIKGLIGNSVGKVEAGSRLVADAGKTMSEIVGSVQRVSDIIGEITAAAGEQSDGIAQVNTAVSQLDQMTQQNAALVEESAAAAESLRGQAMRLAQVVQVFRIGSTEAAPALMAPAKAQTPVRQSPNQLRRPAVSAPAIEPKHTQPVRQARAGAVPSSRPATPVAAGEEGDWESF